jgi:hypothetical protein
MSNSSPIRPYSPAQRDKHRNGRPRDPRGQEPEQARGFLQNGPEELEQVGASLGALLPPGVVVRITGRLPNPLAEAATHQRAILGLAQLEMAPQHRDAPEGEIEAAQSARARGAKREKTVAN